MNEELSAVNGVQINEMSFGDYGFSALKRFRSKMNPLQFQIRQVEMFCHSVGLRSQC